MKNVNNKAGISILEVVVAGFILLLAIIPIYKSLTAQTSSEIETTKIAMAKDVLKSLRQEIMARTFDEVTSIVSNPLAQPYPLTLDKVLKIQKEFQNFDLAVVASFTDVAKKVAQFTGTVTWKNNKGLEKKETLTFIQISQK
ncbi:MAG: hypothetical protein HQM09_05750 [Candidatus Riflebacteria bacterium]|nr:hypothetical protein [Candidatus Riflebacteria bacterium]